MLKRFLIGIPIMLITVMNLVTGCSQGQERIKIVSVIPSENTGQDYSAWLNDNISELIPNCWTRSNFKYVDVLLHFASACEVTKLSLYDFEGVFNDNPASIYAVNGDQKTLIGIFKGDQYKTFVDMLPLKPITADALLIHKYANNIPEKIKVYGRPLKTGKAAVLQLLSPVISFENLDNKFIGAPPVRLVARSTNMNSPLTFKSSNPSIFSIDQINGEWIGKTKDTGAVTLSVSQPGSKNYAAADTAKTIYIRTRTPDSVVGGKIPLDAERWIQLTNASNGLQKLFDGRTDSSVQTGYGKVLPNYDSYYPVLNGEEIDLSGVRFYDGEGENKDRPMTLSIITEEGQKIVIGVFNGSKYNSWVGPDPNTPDSFKLQTTFYKIKYIVINSWDFFPNEIEFLGNYLPPTAVSPFVHKSFPLKQLFGVNGFEWNFEAPGVPGKVDEKRFASAKSFSGLRHYLDWQKLEFEEGKYTFNPVFDGGWNYDALYDSCKLAGIEVLACIKTVPAWMLKSYPVDQRDPENIPVRFGKDLLDPRSYVEQAKCAFQYTARYGNNQQVNRNLLHVNSVPRWQGDAVNSIRVGLNLVHFIECDNERDKWWKGRKAYQTAFEYAANLSAFYDGNKNTMGPGVGVKNADPGMLVVMGGTASSTTEYLRGMIEWCRLYRGYKPDGSIDLCWDIINYHYYSNDSKNSQTGKPTRGAAPELSGSATVAIQFIKVAHELAYDMPVWITELGYDINQGSPFKAVSIGNKSALQTQADWILRSSLLYARMGIARTFFYMMYDDNLNNSLQFSSSGLLNADFSRKPAANLINQVRNRFGEYHFAATVQTDPLVDRYELNGNAMYVVYVPDEKGMVAKLSLSLPGADSANVFSPQYNSEEMDLRKMAVKDASLPLTATETPLFIVPFTKSRLSDNGTNNPSDEDWSNSIRVFPSPASDNIYISVNNQDNSRIGIKIIQEGSGLVYKNLEVHKNSTSIHQTVDIRGWPNGYYLVQLLQGSKKKLVKILKRNL